MERVSSDSDEESLSENVKSAIEKALKSLASCEQCRFSLERKLMQKGFEKEDITAALDYLEQKGFLDDERYASIWIKNQCMFNFHGRARLLRDLLVHGVKKTVADKVINEYLTLNLEKELCLKAYKRYVKQGKTGENMLRSLSQSGFSYNIIQKIIKSDGSYAAE